jgi:fructose-1-phosphate kinase PfkB-like protein
MKALKYSVGAGISTAAIIAALAAPVGATGYSGQYMHHNHHHKNNTRNIMNTTTTTNTTTRTYTNTGIIQKGSGSGDQTAVQGDHSGVFDVYQSQSQTTSQSNSNSNWAGGQLNVTVQNSESGGSDK